jgi:hypothetical protein
VEHGDAIAVDRELDHARRIRAVLRRDQLAAVEVEAVDAGGGDAGGGREVGERLARDVERKQAEAVVGEVERLAIGGQREALQRAKRTGEERRELAAADAVDRGRLAVAGVGIAVGGDGDVAERVRLAIGGDGIGADQLARGEIIANTPERPLSAAR